MEAFLCGARAHFIVRSSAASLSFEFSIPLRRPLLTHSTFFIPIVMKEERKRFLFNSIGPPPHSPLVSGFVPIQGHKQQRWWPRTKNRFPLTLSTTLIILSPVCSIYVDVCSPPWRTLLDYVTKYHFAHNFNDLMERRDSLLRDDINFTHGHCVSGEEQRI